MRHRKSNHTLTSNTNYTLQLLYNLSVSFIEHKRLRLNTTIAKEFKSYFEKLITLAKKIDKQSNYRILYSKLHSNKELIKKLSLIANDYESRPGGYMRVLRVSRKKGDGTSVSIVELV